MFLKDQSWNLAIYIIYKRSTVLPILPSYRLHWWHKIFNLSSSQENTNLFQINLDTIVECCNKFELKKYIVCFRRNHARLVSLCYVNDNVLELEITIKTLVYPLIPIYFFFIHLESAFRQDMKLLFTYLWQKQVLCVGRQNLLLVGMPTYVQNIYLNNYFPYYCCI